MLNNLAICSFIVIILYALNSYLNTFPCLASYFSMDSLLIFKDNCLGVILKKFLNDFIK